MSVFPTKILVATDGSRDAQLGVEMAMALVDATGSELHVVHVAPVTLIPYHQGIPGGTEPARVQREARRLLDEQVERIKAAGGSITQSYLRMGGAAEEIVTLGEEIGAGLIVVGSRGRGRLRRALMGSVSDAVVRHAHCPVLVVRGEENGEPSLSSSKILLATDGSEEAQLAARTAVELANATSSELHVVHVGHSLGLVGGVGPDLGPLPGSQEAFDRRAGEVLEAQLEQIEAVGGTVTCAHLFSGRPDDEIVALAEEIGAGLIVIGSRGLGGIRRALMGSISDSVVRHAHCPVLVVRREEQLARLTAKQEQDERSLR